MTKRKSYEDRLLEAYERGEMPSTSPTKTDLRRLKEAARATFIKDRRINVRLSSPDLKDIQARAAEEGVPYQTLIASVLHKYVTGRLSEAPSRLTIRAVRRAKRRRAA